MARTKSNSEARGRILETADLLFYREGIRAVGIDRIIAEAGVAKMTLYSHFPSKDDLILAVLQHREHTVMHFFQTAMERLGKRHKEPLRAFFAALQEHVEAPDYRGCAFQNTSIELADPSHPGAAFVSGQKRRFGEFLRGLVETAIGHSAAWTAAAISLLVEGALVTAVVQGSPAAVEIARDAALKLAAVAK